MEEALGSVHSKSAARLASVQAVELVDDKQRRLPTMFDVGTHSSEAGTADESPFPFTGEFKNLVTLVTGMGPTTAVVTEHRGASPMSDACQQEECGFANVDVAGSIPVDRSNNVENRTAQARRFAGLLGLLVREFGSKLRTDSAA